MERDLKLILMHVAETRGKIHLLTELVKYKFLSKPSALSFLTSSIDKLRSEIGELDVYRDYLKLYVDRLEKYRMIPDDEISKYWKDIARIVNKIDFNLYVIFKTLLEDIQDNK